MKIIKYPDGSSYVKIDEYSPRVVMRINSYENLWQLNQYVEVCNHKGYIPTILIPNLIDAQADRRFKNDESSGLKLVLSFLKQMNAKFIIFHPHNAELVEGILGDAVEIMDNSSFIMSTIDYIKKELISANEKSIGETLILMSTDAGGFKPLCKLAEIIEWKGETYSASKSRSWDDVEGTKFIQQIDREDFGGKDILLIDDLCIYGGTIKGIHKLLQGKNCGKIYVATSHITVQNQGSDPVTNYCDHMFTTNSKYDVYTSIDGTKLSNLTIFNYF